MKKFYPINLIKMTKIGRRLYLQYRYYFTEPFTYFLVGMTQKEREDGASHTLLAVRFITYQHHSLLSNIPFIAPLTHAFWFHDFFYGYCINDTDLQTITKTEVVGLQKLKCLIFLFLINTNLLRYILTDPMSVLRVTTGCILPIGYSVLLPWIQTSLS